MKNILPFLIIALTLLSACENEPRTEVVSYCNVTNVGDASADVFVDGHIFAHNPEYVQNWGFYYGTNPDPKIDGKQHQVDYYSRDYQDITINHTITGLTDSTTYYVQVFCNYGSDHYLSDDIISFQTVAGPTTYSIGDTGPGGGIVFSVNVGGLTGMEMSPIEYFGNWGCNWNVVGTSSFAGTGANNTSLILATCPSATSAPAICSNLIESGYDDWHLPSQGDLTLIRTNLVNNSFWTPATGYYMSSSQSSSISYLTYDLMNGFSGNTTKLTNSIYFAVRFF